MTTTDVLVIGGGPAGAAAAARLAGGGLRVTLYERRREPDRQVCGEFVSGAASAELAALGVELIRLGARHITRARVCGQRPDITTPLPFTAYGLSRARLDRSLLELAARRGATLRVGVAVRGIERSDGAWTATLSDGGEVQAGAVVFATGKHDLRGHARAWSSSPPMVGFKMHYRLGPEQTASLDETVELFLYEHGYAGLQLIEGGVANLCLVLSADCVRGGAHGWQNALSYLGEAAPALLERLRHGRPLWDRPVSVARIPYGWIYPVERVEPGLYPIGDQAAVIPSLAGEGIAIALRSGRRAADAVLAGQAACSYVRTIGDDVRPAMRSAKLIDTMLRRRPLRRLGLGIAALPGVLPFLARLTRLAEPEAAIG
jgi:menaquinone-9 beta-reductase